MGDAPECWVVEASWCDRYDDLYQDTFGPYPSQTEAVEAARVRQPELASLHPDLSLELWVFRLTRDGLEVGGG